MYKKISLPISEEVSKLLLADKEGSLPKVYNVASLMSLFYAVGNQRLHVIESITDNKIVYNNSITKIDITKNSINFVHGGFKTLKGRKLLSLLDSLDVYEKPVTLSIEEFLTKLGYSVDYYSNNIAWVRRDILEPALKDMRNNGYTLEYEFSREGSNRVITFTYAE